MSLTRKQKLCIWLISATLLLALVISTAYAFSGEGAAVSSLPDFLLKKDLLRLGIELISSLMEMCRTRYVELLTTNPNVMENELKTVNDYMIGILGPIFVTSIILGGVYMIFFSGTPKVRSQVKAIIPGMVAAMILVLISPHIMNVLFYFSEGLTEGILSQGPKNPMMIILPSNQKINPSDYLMDKFERLTWYSAEGSFPFLLANILLLGGLLFTVVARYFAVSLFSMIFPITIFLYLFIPTRTLGKRLAEQTIIWIFLQAIQAIALVSTTTIILLLSPYFMEDILVLLNLAAIIFMIITTFAAIIFFRDFLPQ